MAGMAKNPKGWKEAAEMWKKNRQVTTLWLGTYYGNRKGAGNPKFFPHRTVR